MRKAVAALVGLLAATTVLVQLATLGNADGAPNSQSGQGVTSSSIRVGITYPDVAAIRNIINVNPGDYRVAYTALINQLNAHGGINGRKIVPVFAPVDPLGTAGAATACTQLTEDDKVFVVLGFFQAADTACYLQTHDVPIIGASLSSTAAAQAKAPWFNNLISDSSLVPKEMAVFKQEGAFTGKKVAVVGQTADQAEVNLVVPVLHRLKVDVVQVAINDAPGTDTAALTAQYAIIAQKFKSSGANLVVAVGNAGQQWPRALQSNQSTYLPRLVTTDYTTLDAYVADKAGYSQAILQGALTAGGIPPPTVIWNDPAMRRCVATIQAAEPHAVIANPVTATASTPVTYTAPEVACTQVALFADIAKAAGPTLNNETFLRGGESLTHVTLPGGGGTFDFSGGHNDGNGPVFVYTWDPKANQLRLKTTVG
ncbi:MAG TPA: ABC transporter substrate-binding protein [Acidimicrobiales bacterium]|nr:ABC transporter substrate-binding protein [Acidimicrobiales bacterium]